VSLVPLLPGRAEEAVVVDTQSVHVRNTIFALVPIVLVLSGCGGAKLSASQTAVALYRHPDITTATATSCAARKGHMATTISVRSFKTARRSVAPVGIRVNDHEITFISG
jgi:hypothetical protein